ncbi:hypothetical protein MY3296_008319 [Beauveria thailandica]
MYLTQDQAHLTSNYLNENTFTNNMSTPTKNFTPAKNLETEEDRSQYMDKGLNLSDKSDTNPKGNSLLEKMKAAESSNATPSASRAQPSPSAHQRVPGNNTSRSVYTVEGSNIGSRANEPEWTEDVKRQARDGDRGRDPQKKYQVIANDVNGTVIAKPPAYLPNMTVDEYKLSLGRGQADQKVGKSNVVIISNKVNLVLNQWTSTEPEPPHQTRLARVGLPKTSFGPMFETLRASMPGLFEDISVTRWYYWLNASPGTFIYKDEDGIKAKTQRLDEAIKRIIGSSSKGVATIAISLSDEATIENGRTVPIGNKYQFSVNLDNMFHFKKERVLPHSPPQSSSTGFEILEDIFSVAVRTIDHQHGLQRHRKLLHAGYGQSVRQRQHHKRHRRQQRLEPAAALD